MSSINLNSEYMKIDQLDSIKQELLSAKDYLGKAKLEIDNPNNKGNKEPAIKAMNEICNQLIGDYNLTSDIIKLLKEKTKEIYERQEDIK